jgi:hypothetical protein
MCFIVHMMGCFWYFIADLEGSPDNWIMRCGYIDADTGAKYLASLYWSVTTLTTIGYGDIVPFTNLEKSITILWMMFGVGFYSFTIGSLSSVLSNIDTRESILSNKLIALNEFCNETGIEMKLKD